MATTWKELLDKLKKIDEISLMELLEISSEDIIDRFGDKIEERADRLFSEIDDAEENEEY